MFVSDPSYGGLITSSEFTRRRRFQSSKIIIFADEGISFGIWPIEIQQAKEEKKIDFGANFSQKRNDRSFLKTSAKSKSE